jgi:hypothetical protein
MLFAEFGSAQGKFMAGSGSAGALPAPFNIDLFKNGPGDINPISV